jgi:riboflavin synthase
MKYIVEKGSIAVDGISLTVAAVKRDWFRIWIIPHTRDITNLLQCQAGDTVNLEADVLAKYIEKLLPGRRG